MEYPAIRDDGTMDTLVEYRGKFHRFNSEYRFQFKNDDEFLATIKEELEQ